MKNNKMENENIIENYNNNTIKSHCGLIHNVTQQDRVKAFTLAIKNLPYIHFDTKFRIRGQSTSNEPTTVSQIAESARSSGDTARSWFPAGSLYFCVSFLFVRTD